MFKVKLADLVIGIDNQYSYTKELCREYITDSSYIDFCVSATNEQIKAEDNGEGFSIDYLESLALYRRIAEKLIEYGGFLMHGVTLSVEGRGVIFTASSGTGKTTHAMYWKQLLGDKCIIVNGDKPLIRFINDICYAYGTPWCGKEQLHTNTRTPLTDLFIVNRAEDNRVCDLRPKEAMLKVLAAVYKPSDPELFSKTIEYLDLFLEKVKVRNVYCNMSIDAAKAAYGALN